MYNIATNQSFSVAAGVPQAAGACAEEAVPAAGDVLARVTRSAQSSVERGLHKLQFRAMSTHC